VRAARAVKNSVSDAAELWIAPNKQFCLQPSLAMNVDRDGDKVTSAGRLFHTRAASTGNERSPTVDRRVTGTTSVLVDAERRHRRASRSATHWRSLARYDGARPLRQR